MRKATGSYRTYSIPGKTVALVPDFAVEVLPFGRTAALVPALAVNELPWVEHSDDDDDDDDILYIHIVILIKTQEQD